LLDVTVAEAQFHPYRGLNGGRRAVEQPRVEERIAIMRRWIDLSSEGIQFLAVAIIVFTIAFASVRFVWQLSKRAKNPYRAYKDLLGQSLLLTLEILVAADVIHTVVLDLTVRGLALLGALVVIRTLLSWSVAVETEGHWPWRSAAVEARRF
jgi:uncharacterized membrane protein